MVAHLSLSGDAVSPFVVRRSGVRYDVQVDPSGTRLTVTAPDGTSLGFELTPLIEALGRYRDDVGLLDVGFADEAGSLRATPYAESIDIEILEDGPRIRAIEVYILLDEQE